MTFLQFLWILACGASLLHVLIITALDMEKYYLLFSLMTVLGLLVTLPCLRGSKKQSSLLFTRLTRLQRQGMWCC